MDVEEWWLLFDAKRTDPPNKIGLSDDDLAELYALLEPKEVS